MHAILNPYSAVSNLTMSGMGAFQSHPKMFMTMVLQCVVSTLVGGCCWLLKQAAALSFC